MTDQLNKNQNYSDKKQKMFIHFRNGNEIIYKSLFANKMGMRTGGPPFVTTLLSTEVAKHLRWHDLRKLAAQVKY